MTDEAENAEPIACWLCGRPMGEQAEWHHPLPKAKGGRVKVPVHPICHQAIHANFTNSELARLGGDHGPLVEKPEMAKFLDWVAGKPPDFHAPTKPRK